MKTKYKSIWEDYPIEIEKNYEIVNKIGYKCKHIINNKLPIVVIGVNEGGFNSVGMCGECLYELLKKEIIKG